MPLCPAERQIGPGGRRPRVLYAANVAIFFQKFLLPYAEHFRAHGWRVDAISKGFDEVPGVDFGAHFDRLWEVDWARKPHELRQVSKLIRSIRNLVEREEYDIVHVHTPVAAMMTRYALRNRDRERTKLLYTAHGFHFFEGAPKVRATVYKGLESVATRWTDYLVVMNQEDHAAARSLGRIAEHRVKFMPGIGLDLDRYAPDPSCSASVRSELGLSREDTLFLCVAEFIPRKRQTDVLHALQRLNDSRVKVLFAGEGETLESVKRQAVKLGLVEQARFLGLRRDVPRLLSGSDCFVLPSAQEGLPRSVMEAMCCGIPIIASDIRGNRDLLAPTSGTLYPVGDVAALAAAMGAFIKDPERLRAGTLDGILHARTYDIKSVLRMHEELYAAALGVERDGLMDSNTSPRGHLI